VLWKRYGYSMHTCNGLTFRTKVIVNDLLNIGSENVSFKDCTFILNNTIDIVFCNVEFEYCRFVIPFLASLNEEGATKLSHCDLYCGSFV